MDKTKEIVKDTKSQEQKKIISDKKEEKPSEKKDSKSVDHLVRTKTCLT